MVKRQKPILRCRPPGPAGTLRERNSGHHRLIYVGWGLRPTVRVQGRDKKNLRRNFWTNFIMTQHWLNQIHRTLGMRMARCTLLAPGTSPSFWARGPPRQSRVSTTRPYSVGCAARRVRSWKNIRGCNFWQSIERSIWLGAFSSQADIWRLGGDVLELLLRPLDVDP